MNNEPSFMSFAEPAIQRGELTISDMARAYNLSLRTLRFYEDKALLRPRRQGTARYYSQQDRIRLELILKGKRLGFTLAEIYDLIASREKPGAPPVPASERADLTVSLGAPQIEAQIAHLQRQRDDLDSAIEELKMALVRMQATAAP